jgi:outer membrane protein TolC
MRNTPEPRQEFIDRLAASISTEVRRRNRLATPPPWTTWLLGSPIKAAIAGAVLVLASMTIGGIVVAAAYQAQTNEQRSALKAQYAARVALAQQRVAILAEQLQNVQRQASVGTEGPEALLDARFKVTEAEAQLRSLVLEQAEVEAAGREPLNAVSSPLVSGRDFVTERWKTELLVPVAALDLEKARLQSLDRRFAVGAANKLDVETSRARIVELEASLAAIQKRLSIRERFVSKSIDAALADLYVLEAEATQRLQTVRPRLDLAQKVFVDLKTKVDTGTATMLDLSQAQLRLKELELEITKAEVDLGVIHRQIDQRRSGK